MFSIGSGKYRSFINKIGIIIISFYVILKVSIDYNFRR